MEYVSRKLTFVHKDGTCTKDVRLVCLPMQSDIYLKECNRDDLHEIWNDHFDEDEQEVTYSYIMN